MNGSSVSSSGEPSKIQPEEDGSAANGVEIEKSAVGLPPSVTTGERLLGEDALKWMFVLLRASLLVPYGRAERVASGFACLVCWYLAIIDALFLEDTEDFFTDTKGRGILLSATTLWFLMCGGIRLWMLVSVSRERLAMVFACLVKGSYWTLALGDQSKDVAESFSRRVKVWSVVCFAAALTSWLLLVFGYIIGAQTRRVFNFPWADWFIEEESPGIHWFGLVTAILSIFPCFVWIVPLLPYSLAINLLHERFRAFCQSLDDSIRPLERQKTRPGEPSSYAEAAAGKKPSVRQLTLAHRQLCQGVMMVDRTFRAFVAISFTINTALSILVVYRIVFFGYTASSAEAGAFVFWCVGLAIQFFVCYKSAKLFSWHEHLRLRCHQVQVGLPYHASSTPTSLASQMTRCHSVADDLTSAGGPGGDSSTSSRRAVTQEALYARQERLELELEHLRFSHQVESFTPGITVGGAVTMNWRVLGVAASVTASVFVFLYETRKNNRGEGE